MANPPDILTMKRKMLAGSYRGIGRPRKIDYEYKSIVDMMFEVDKIFNQRIDNQMLTM